MGGQKQVKTCAEKQTNGEEIEILFWVGCAGSFDERYKRVTLAMINILERAGINFAVLGEEETCTGDPARRAGNEFLFQMQAVANIQTLNTYNIKKIVTACPHCFNTLKNEYPELGGNYEVVHHSVFLQQLIDEGRLKVKEGDMSENKTVYHDSCYLGRSNNIYAPPRKVLEALQADLVEMKRCGTVGLCCGAGGAQMFKESEKGNTDINVERAKEAIDTGASTIATACPFCMTMLSDGIKNENKEDSISVMDIAEIVNNSI